MIMNKNLLKQYARLVAGVGIMDISDIGHRDHFLFFFGCSTVFTIIVFFPRTIISFIGNSTSKDIVRSSILKFCICRCSLIPI